MKVKIKQWKAKQVKQWINEAPLEEIVEAYVQDLGLSNEWVSEIDKIEPDPDYGMPDYYQGFYDAIEAVEKLIPPSEAKL